MPTNRKKFWLMLATAFFSGMVCGAALFGQTPSTELHAALADLDRVPQAEWPTTRYLSLYNVPRHDRPEVQALLSLTLNLVSRSSRIAHPAIVVGSDGRLLRINLLAYGLPPEDWEKLLELGEPYWHLRTQVVPPGGKQPKTVFTDGGWVGLPNAASLRAKTGSAGAIIRGDWFVAKAITTVDGGQYYQLTGIAAAADANALYESLGIDFRATDRLNAEAWTLQVRSAVTHRFRKIVRRQGAMGGAWKTEDSIDEAADEDPLRNPLVKKHDASEHVLAARNGLPWFALYDGAGKLVNVVPPDLAADHTSAHGDAQLAPALSCISCHPEDGLRPVANDLRRLIAGEVEAFFTDPAAAEKAAAIYERDMQRSLERDRQDFAAAFSAATGGLTVEEISERLPAFYRRYAWDQVSPAIAAAELGAPRGVPLRQVLGRSLDPILLALCEGLSVQRKQFEASFAEAALLVASQAQEVN